MTRILFLCTGNSCRSQIAEGWARQLSGDRVQVQSAGIEAHGKNPHAVAVMQEAGVDISQQPSTRLTDKILVWADVLVTVCGHAEDQCPVLPQGLRKEHWPLEDPASAIGSEKEIISVFRTTRDDIRQRVVDLIQRLGQ